MAEIPRLFCETMATTAKRSKSAWDSLMDNSERIPTYSQRTLHSRALADLKLSGRVLDQNHSFYNSQDYQRERTGSQIRTKIDLTMGSEGVK